MRIGVTGGSGRIGRAVVDLALSQGHQVVSIDRVAPPAEAAARPNVTYVVADLGEYAVLEGHLQDCDGLVHLAAIPSPNNRPDYEVHNTNVVASYNALSAAARLGIDRVAQASSINATGAAYSRKPRYDYFPLDEQHPTYNEDPYSLSKWICEEQADSFVRRYQHMRVTSLRFHGVVPDRSDALARQHTASPVLAKHLWGYTTFDAAARSCLLSLTADFDGHQVFYIVATNTMMDTASLELKQRHYPEVPVRGNLDSNRAFFDSSKAERLLGWQHDAAPVAGRVG